MRRRRRAVAFAAAAAVCAGLAAGASGGPATGSIDQLGQLRQVLVTTAALPGRREVDERAARELVEVRRVPDRFLPAGALSDPAQIVGRRPAVAVPAGTYVVDSQFRPTGPVHRPPAELDRGHRPVEIAVSGAGALSTRSPGRRFDVVVTTEPGPGGRGRTYVAAQAVELLEIRAFGPDAGTVPGVGGEPSIATLALTRRQALRLIQAESFARSVRLIAR